MFIDCQPLSMVISACKNTCIFFGSNYFSVNQAGWSLWVINNSLMKVAAASLVYALRGIPEIVSVHFLSTNFHPMGERLLFLIHSLLSLFPLCLLYGRPWLPCENSQIGFSSHCGLVGTWITTVPPTVRQWGQEDHFQSNAAKIHFMMAFCG